MISVPAIYISRDELESFQFHDARLKEVRFTPEGIVWTVSDLDTTTENSQNSSDIDLCIDAARLVFEKGMITEMVTLASQTFSAEGKLIADDPARTMEPSCFSQVFSATANRPIYIQSLESLAEIPGGYSAQFLLDFGPELIDTTIQFQSVRVEWDGFCGPAWYVGWPHPKP